MALDFGKLLEQIGGAEGIGDIFKMFFASQQAGDRQPVPGLAQAQQFGGQAGQAAQASIDPTSSQFQNLAARSDPTIPRLINSQLQTFVDQKNTGGFDANAFLSGDFSFAGPSNPTTLGAGSGSP